MTKQTTEVLRCAVCLLEFKKEDFKNLPNFILEENSPVCIDCQQLSHFNRELLRTLNDIYAALAIIAEK